MAWFQRLTQRLGRVFRKARVPSRRPRVQLRVEALENRVTPATSFAYAVSANDLQIYQHQLELGQPPSGSWTLTAPRQFRSVVADNFGGSGTPIAFGIGLDNQVYRTKFNAAGQATTPWMLVAPGQFDALVVSRYGFSGGVIVFGIGTIATSNHDVFAARFDTNGNLLSGWFRFAPGQFDVLAVDNFGTLGGVELFGINSIDRQVRAARFDALGVFIDGWSSFAPGVFQSIAVANRSNGTLELFGVGVNGQAFAANFTNTGILANGWFAVNTAQPFGFTQVVAAALGTTNGNLIAFGLGTDQRAYQAVFSFGTGVKIGGWTPLATTQLTQLAAGNQDGFAKLYAIGRVNLQVYVEVFDANGLVETGFAVTPSGRFSNVDTAP